MKVEHLPAVLSIERLSFASPWSRGQFVDEIQRNPLSFPFVLLKRKNAATHGLVGFCVPWIVREELHINNLAIHPHERGKGYGELLLRKALDVGEASRCRNATLEVRTTNGAAIRLYEKIGFRRIGIAPGYYEDTGEDAFILVKPLTPGI